MKPLCARSPESNPEETVGKAAFCSNSCYTLFTMVALLASAPTPVIPLKLCRVAGYRSQAGIRAGVGGGAILDESTKESAALEASGSA